MSSVQKVLDIKNPYDETPSRLSDSACEPIKIPLTRNKETNNLHTPFFVNSGFGVHEIGSLPNQPAAYTMDSLNTVNISSNEQLRMNEHSS